MRGKRPRLVIRHDSRWKTWLVAPVVFVISAGGGWFFSEYLSKWVEQRTAKSRAQLEAELMELREENAQLRERVVLAERSSQINQQAAMEVKRNLTALQDELLALRQEVTFYRNIVSPPDAKPGLRVQSLKLEKGSAEGLFRFKLVLTQVKGNDQLVRGAVNLMVEGHEAGEQKRLPMEMVLLPKGRELVFGFRYFQNLEGELQLPAGFVPQRIVVQVVPQQGRQPGTEKAFDWGTLFKAAGPARS